jgi:hypothetical protein
MTTPPITKIVAVQECAVGNGEVGSMWLESAIFDASDPIINIVRWATSRGGAEGKVIITIPSREPTPH